jgi:tRNA threonylcarbamoyladenosine biosynthesis protein TsaB
MNTLVIDTSGSCSVIALVRDDGLLGYISIRAQSLTHLHPSISYITNSFDMELASLDQIAVVTGPGSWTGLNIGLTAAKTLAQVLELPIVPIPTLTALAAGQLWTKGPIWSVLDAKRGNVYFCEFSTNEYGVPNLAEANHCLVSFDWLKEKLANESGMPLIIEYGDALQSKIADEMNGVHSISYKQFEPNHLLKSLEVAQSNLLTGDCRLNLSPEYLQDALPTQKKA